MTTAIDPSRPIVLALGGNAITPPGEEGNIDQQFAHTRRSTESIAHLATTGVPLVITHGNGPQVGNVVRRVELAAREVYTLPLHVCVADTQAGMGYMIAQCLINEFRHQGIARGASCLITQVEVDPADPGFQNPTKPIGRHYAASEIDTLQAHSGWELREVTPGKFRRVVPSPAPLKIIELETIRSMIHAGHVLVAAGGGGIPVMRDATGDLSGVDAVIDKDRASALLAAGLGAQALVILTGVERVALRYGKPDERWLDTLTIAEARQWLAAGEFPAGSMGPKIQAAIDFLAMTPDPAARVLITDLDHLSDALAGRTGTQIVR